MPIVLSGSVMYWERIIHWRAYIGNFSSSVQLDISRVREENKCDSESKTRKAWERKISYLPTTMYYFVYYMNTIGLYWQEKSTLTRNDLGLRIVNGLPFIQRPERVAKKASDVSAADWRYQTHVKNYLYYTHAQLKLFPRMVILVINKMNQSLYKMKMNNDINSTLLYRRISA